MVELVHSAAMMEAAITGVDHSIVGVVDLEAARAAYQALGFTITPRGRHIGWSTANYCIMFERDYVELLGIIEPGDDNAGLDDTLAEQGEGLLKLALRSKDAARTYEFFENQSLITEPVKKLASRNRRPHLALPASPASI
jgi:hypothetical protein